MKISRTMRRHTYVTLAPVPNSVKTEIEVGPKPASEPSSQTETTSEDMPQITFVPECECNSQQTVTQEVLQSSPEKGTDRVREMTRTEPSEALLPLTIRTEAAISKCAQAESSFFNQLDQTGQALAPAFELLTLLLIGGDPAIDAVIRHPEFPARERAPQRRNLALIAVLLRARPRTKEQRKWCSDWATVLIEAAHLGIPVEGFAEWTAGVTLKHCKNEVRKRRRDEKKDVLERPVSDLKLQTTGDIEADPFAKLTAAKQPYLEIRLVNGSTIASTYPIVVSEQTCLTIVRAIQNISPSCRAFDALWVLAESIDGVELNCGRYQSL